MILSRNLTFAVTGACGISEVDEKVQKEPHANAFSGLNMTPSCMM